MCRCAQKLLFLTHAHTILQRKVDETAEVMAEVERTSQMYTPLSVACSSIFFTMEQLNQVRRARV